MTDKPHKSLEGIDIGTQSNSGYIWLAYSAFFIIDPVLSHNRRLWIESGMRRATGNNDFGGPCGLAASFEPSLWSVRGLEHQGRRASPRFAFDQQSRAFASGLFV